MKEVLFYEKPGCVNNAKQKKSLKSAGFTLVVKNLLDHGMSAKELLSYLEDKEVTQWFNPNAPAIKKGQIDPNAYSKEEALALLYSDPILIRRPLLEIEGVKMCGFDSVKIEKLTQKKLSSTTEEKCFSAVVCPSPVSSATFK